MRTITSLTTIFALALGLTACGDDKNETTTNQTTNTTPGTTGATETASGTTGPGTSEPTTEPTTAPATESATTEPATTTATESATTEPATTTATATESGTTTTVDPSSTTAPETTGGVEPDTKWPPPDPGMPMMPCPDGYVAASFVMGGLVCSPSCSGPGKICPAGDTGSAKGQCVFNPKSTGAACKMGDKCMDAMETCQMTGGGGFACLKPSDHCALLCNGGESCPAGMECAGMLVCQYPG